MKKLFFLLLLSTMVACANPYAKFYNGMADARVHPYYQPAQEPLKIYSTDNAQRDGLALIRNGYFLIGQSLFNAGFNNVKEGQLRAQAEKVGAQVVLVASRYTHTFSGAIPFFIPQTTTSSVSFSGTAYGPSGGRNVVGSGTVTTYETQALMLPYSVARGDFFAAFFAKVSIRLGALVAELDPEARSRLGYKHGVRVVDVVDGSPAFEAGIRPGDVLLSLGSDSIQSVGDFNLLVSMYGGQTVLIEVDRDGDLLEKQVQIRSCSDAARQESQ